MEAGGVISGEIRQSGVRIGFSLEDLITHEQGTLAHVDMEEGPRIGKYRVNLRDLERVGVAAIRRALASADIVIVDELGPMELCSQPFISAVEEALASSKPFLGTIHKRASHRLVTSIKTNPQYYVVEVTQQNRQEIPNRIVGRLKEA